MARKSRFVGRERELATLDQEYGEAVRSGRGRFVLVRGRRRVGKSRLVEEFLDRRGAPSAFFAASRGRSADRELARFAELAGSADTGGALPAGIRFDSWTAALTTVATTASRERPVVVVLDELPYLLEGDAGVEGELQTVWDRTLKDLPVLLIVVGSDLAVMDALTTYGRPLFDRPTRILEVTSLTPGETGAMLGLDPIRSFETFLVLGGFPALAETWRSSDTLGRYLERELVDPTSPLVVSGERMLNAEFPARLQARKVLSAVGAGERTFKGIGEASGVPAPTLQVTLPTLVEKQVLEKRLPLSAKASKEARYLVMDPFLRFWLRFVEPGLEEIERGRGDRVVDRVRVAWSGYRGLAVEPMVREAFRRRAPDPKLEAANVIGGYWTRRNDPEIDLVGMDARQGGRVVLVGTIKWHERRPLDDADADALLAKAIGLPGLDPRTLTVGVSFSGFRTDRLDLCVGPEDILY